MLNMKNTALGILVLGLFACGSDNVPFSAPDPEPASEGPACGKLTTCDAACVDHRFDPQHCGACGRVCEAGEHCDDGLCVGACGPGTVACTDGCVDTQLDPRHCGGCDRACASGLACVGGVCDASCSPTTTSCGGSCVDTQSDPANCGGCGTACPDVSACAGGSCLVVSLASCLAIQQAFPAPPSGIYSLDPDGIGGDPPFNAFCDMATDDGGWTLIARFSNEDADRWMNNSGLYWYDAASEVGAATSRSATGDMISRGFWTVPADELKLSRTDNNDDAHLLLTVGGCLAGNTFRDHITSFGDFRDGAPWATNAALGMCAASLGSNFAQTQGFSQAQCSGNIGAPSALSFWTHWGGSTGDAAVMMIGGGGLGCDGADHGVGATGSNASGFATLAPGFNESDFGDAAAPQGTSSYAVNLLVR
jgi:Stigma-specific protein, Stig1